MYLRASRVSSCVRIASHTLLILPTAVVGARWESVMRGLYSVCGDVLVAQAGEEQVEVVDISHLLNEKARCWP